MEANTLYPLLRRLEKQGLLKSEWETAGAKPRKYYVRTELGEAVYQKLKAHWQKLTKTWKNCWEDTKVSAKNYIEETIDRYVYQVVRRVPRKSQKDIEKSCAAS